MPETQASMSLIELLMKGGIVMIPIGILSIVSIYVMIERFIFIRQASRI
jgi:biopolymer transport protein ExbB